MSCSTCLAQATAGILGSAFGPAGVSRTEARSRECHPETAQCFSAPAPTCSQARPPSGPEDDTSPPGRAVPWSCCPARSPDRRRPQEQPPRDLALQPRLPRWLCASRHFSFPGCIRISPLPDSQQGRSAAAQDRQMKHFYNSRNIALSAADCFRAGGITTVRPVDAWASRTPLIPLLHGVCARAFWCLRVWTT